MKAVDKTQLSLPPCLNGNLSITKPNMLKIEVLSAFKCQIKIFASSFSTCFSLTMKPQSKFLGKRGDSVKRQHRNSPVTGTQTTPHSFSCTFPGQRQRVSAFGRNQPPKQSVLLSSSNAVCSHVTDVLLGSNTTEKNTLGLQFPFPSTQPAQVHSWKMKGRNFVSEELNFEEKEEKPRLHSWCV